MRRVSLEVEKHDYKEKESTQVKQMFSGIAPRYDLLNHLLSFGFDIGWRKKVALETGKIHCKRILDICTGTGDMAIELCKFWKGKAHIEAVDFSRELLEVGKTKSKRAGLSGKITFSETDAEELPYEDEQFDAVTIVFGLRNIQDRLKALKEFYRVTKTDGRIICLEFSQPTNPIFARFYSFYLVKLVPIISILFGSNPDAYRYLGRTIREFPPPLKLISLIESAGWKDVTYYNLTGGIVAVHQGKKC